MTARIPLWSAGVGCVLSFIIGAGLGRGPAVRAQDAAPQPPAQAQPAPSAQPAQPSPNPAPPNPAAPPNQPDNPASEAPQQEILSEYPYLPSRYGEVHIPSVAEWAAMQVTALGASETRLTEHFSRKHLVCAPTRRTLVLTLDLKPLDTWKHYAGGGKFSAPPATVKPDLEKAIASGMKLVHTFFPEVRDESIRLLLFINSERVGEWTAGKLILDGEQPAAQ